MRSESDIDAKIESLRKKSLSSKKKKLLEVKFYNCRYNKKFKIERNGNVGFCQNEDLLKELKQPVLACSCSDSAKLCKRFDNVNTVESVEQDFNEMIHSPNRCMRENPKLATLLWVRYGEEPKRRFGRLLSVIFDLLFFRWW